MKEESRTAFKTWVDIFQGTVTAAAILAGGWWFIAQQTLKPLVKLEQSVSQRPLEGHPGYWLVAVDVHATNIGKVKVKLEQGTLLLTYINPIPGKDFDHANLTDLELEPGEGDQALFRTFAISDTMKTVQITSSYEVPGSKNYQWRLASVLDVGEINQTASHTNVK